MQLKYRNKKCVFHFFQKMWILAKQKQISYSEVIFLLPCHLNLSIVYLRLTVLCGYSIEQQTFPPFLLCYTGARCTKPSFAKMFAKYMYCSYVEPYCYKGIILGCILTQETLVNLVSRHNKCVIPVIFKCSSHPITIDSIVLKQGETGQRIKIPSCYIFVHLFP